MRLVLLVWAVRILVVSSLVLISANARSQPTDSIPTKPKSILKTAPIHLEEINLAYELLNRPNRSWQLGIGYIYKLQTNKGVLIFPRATELKGFSVRISRRNYKATQLPAPQGVYRGPEVTYRYMAFPEGFIYDEYGNPRMSRLFQQVFSLQYKWGMQRVFKNRWVLDGYLGVGGRMKYAYRDDPGAPENYKMRIREFYGFPVKVEPDQAVILAPTVSLNLAIGVAF